MGNMSYCRFENTLPDLLDCVEHTYEFGTEKDFLESLSKHEAEAARQLFKLCRRLAERFEDET